MQADHPRTRRGCRAGREVLRCDLPALVLWSRSVTSGVRPPLDALMRGDGSPGRDASNGRRMSILNVL
ncbi:MAG: hypothetical protein IT446_11525 [Phycisphaerales bacterium]|nr:hypothetical protein [Phycisphaerales bacterium]